jgi:hypothetical protein
MLPKIKIHDPSYLPLFYILEGVKVGYFSSINQLFSHNSEFKTSVSRCCANQFWILLLFMMMNGFYSNRLILGGAQFAPLDTCFQNVRFTHKVKTPSRTFYVRWSLRPAIQIVSSTGRYLGHNSLSNSLRSMILFCFLNSRFYADNIRYNVIVWYFFNYIFVLPNFRFW